MSTTSESWGGGALIDEEMPEFLRIPPSDIEIGVQIGQGGFAIVHKASWRGKPCAAKVVRTADVVAIQKEVSILSKLSHPNVVNCLGFSVDSVGDPSRCMILMELLERDLRGLMDERLKKDPSLASPFSSTESADILYQIATGMEYLHGQGVFHGDLKASNILVSHGSDGELVVKITDFGVSQMVKVDGAEKSEEFMKKKHFRGAVGTRGYQAPEVSSSSVRFYDEPKGVYVITPSFAAPEAFTIPRRRFSIGIQEKSADFYSSKADTYCFAMTCYEILSGRVPFEFVSKADIPARVLQGVRPELPDDLDSRLTILLTECWHQKPSARPRFKDIRYRLSALKPGLPSTLSGLSEGTCSEVHSRENASKIGKKTSKTVKNAANQKEAPNCFGGAWAWSRSCCWN